MSSRQWKQDYDLTSADLQRFPVWYSVGSSDLEEADELDDEDLFEVDEATVRPRDGLGALTRPASLDEVALVAVTIRLADGSSHAGFIWHQDPEDHYGLTLVSDEAHVPIAPTHGAGIAQATGVPADAIFPISFEAVVEIKDLDSAGGRQILRGTVPGA